MSKDKKDKGQHPWRITPEDARAEAARLRERRDAADREAAPLFASQLADGELISDEAPCTDPNGKGKLLEAAIADTLEEPALSKFMAHCEECPHCEAEYTKAVEVEARLQSDLDTVRGIMGCAEWERLLDHLEVEMTDEQTRDWCAHAEACPACGAKLRELEPENLDPRIARFLSDKGFPEKGIPPGREMARKIWEQVRGESAPEGPPATT